MEFKGQTFNLFGGLTEDVFRRLRRLWDYQGRIISADQPCPDFGGLLLSRNEEISGIDKSEWSHRLRQKQLLISYFDRVAHRNCVVLGDSHALSAWRPEHEILRYDGLTLHGALERRIANLLPGHLQGHRPLELTVCLGNIDIRHHIFRQEDPVEAIQKLVYELATQLYDLHPPCVRLVAPYYVESEARRIPKTGWYKGEPFYGSWEQRNWAREYMAELMAFYCREFCWQLIQLPPNFKNTLGEMDEDRMERPRSVHLSPEHYQFDLDTGKQRW
jgi:hypothetical protein